MQLLPQYKHHINPKLKHIYLSFDEEGVLMIKSPKVSNKKIEEILLRKAAWITRARKKIQEKKGKALNFDRPLELYYLGEAYRLQLIAHEKKKTYLSFEHNIFSIYYSLYDEKKFQQLIERFYKEEAQTIIPELVETWAETMSLSYTALKFRKTKRQWGSCSGQNHLSFNTMMMKLPKSVIQYIIIHELAHIKHKHHQKSFWQLVARYLPEYKTQITILKTFTT